MINAIIIDDEQHCIDRLSRLLREEHASGVHLSGTFRSVPDGIAGLAACKPDLVFLDVQLGDQTGFDLLEGLKERRFEVIFTTAHDRFAVQAFRFSALDFLLKPVDAAELSAALQRLMAKSSTSDYERRLEVLLHNLKLTQGIARRIIVPTERGLEIIEVGDIIRCQSDINYTSIFLKGRPKMVVAKTLKEFEELLTEHGFFRLHNSHLINLNYIRTYNKGKGGSVILTDGMEIEVSSRRKDEFLKRLSSL